MLISRETMLQIGAADVKKSNYVLRSPDADCMYPPSSISCVKLTGPGG